MDTGDAEGLSGRLSAERHLAESDDATVRAVVDGSGLVIGVELEPKAMRLDAARLGQAVTETVRSAQQAARDALSGLADAGAATPDTESLTRLATELGASAQQRLNDISGTLDRLLARDTPPRTEA